MLLNPLLIFPTLRATQRTMTICEQCYGKAQHGNGIANAYRHALWNMLICYNAFAVFKDKEKVVKWAKRITGLYEKVVINNPIETAMDLHNNEIGRVYFKNLTLFSEKEILCVLNEKMQNAKMVKYIEEIATYKNGLVYL